MIACQNKDYQKSRFRVNNIKCFRYADLPLEKHDDEDDGLPRRLSDEVLDYVSDYDFDRNLAKFYQVTYEGSSGIRSACVSTPFKMAIASNVSPVGVFPGIQFLTDDEFAFVQDRFAAGQAYHLLEAGKRLGYEEVQRRLDKLKKDYGDGADEIVPKIESYLPAEWNEKNVEESLDATQTVIGWSELSLEKILIVAKNP